jgi:mannose-1-phosphate guanylyltransferase
VPKQFCSLDGGPTLLERTLDRAEAVTSPGRIVTVVAAHHRAHWEPLFDERDPAVARNVIVEPCGRGTAAGLLLPLLTILARDPEAVVVVLPADHCVRRESAVHVSLLEAVARIVGGSAQTVLLGVAPDAPVGDYGWIVPEPAAGRLHRVRRFVEKPAADVAAELYASGALLNTFMLAARARALHALFEQELPELVRALGRLAFEASIEEVYAGLERNDFSRDLLQHCESELRVQELPPCGWTDVGTPERLAAVLNMHQSVALREPRRHGTPVLAHTLQELGAGHGPRALTAAVAAGPRAGRAASPELGGGRRPPPEAACS